MRFSPHGIAFDNGGSVGEMCGNGARCICRYGFEDGLAGETVDENMKWREQTVKKPARLQVSEGRIV